MTQNTPRRWRLQTCYRAAGATHRLAVECANTVDGEADARRQITALTGDQNPTLLGLVAMAIPRDPLL